MVKVWCVFFMLLGFFVVVRAEAAEVEPPVQKIENCDFKPRQTDTVRVVCDTLEGKGYVNIWLCSQLYRVEVDCTKK